MVFGDKQAANEPSKSVQERVFDTLGVQREHLGSKMGPCGAQEAPNEAQKWCREIHWQARMRPGRLKSGPGGVQEAPRGTQKGISGATWTP